MVPRDKVEELVKAHAALDEPTTNAIWIKTETPEVWLVEVIPAMTDDDKAEEPTYFNPGIAFRFPSSSSRVIGRASTGPCGGVRNWRARSRTGQ